MGSNTVLRTNLPQALLWPLSYLAARAQERGVTLYLVGGLLRDVLHNPNVMRGKPLSALDVDIAVEGDAITFLQELACDSTESTPFQLQRLQKFPRYGTAKVRMVQTSHIAPALSASTNGHFELDFARCRKERYGGIAAKPEIVWADILADLWRRDFSLNAIALSLHDLDLAGESVELIDPCAGCAAIEARQLQILHATSFRDDPVRLVRGIRFAQRFGFHYDADTASFAHEAIAASWLSRVQPYRRFDEFRKSMAEESAYAFLESAFALEVLQQLHPLIAVAYERHLLAGTLASIYVDNVQQRLLRYFSSLILQEKHQLYSELEMRKSDRACLYED